MTYEAEKRPSDGGGLAALEQAAKAAGSRGLPPVHLWNPDNCGDLDIRIASDGLWYYLGTPIGRKRLVRLFSTVLRHDDDGRYYLVTPVEKIGIRVDDAPFVAVEMAIDGEGREQRISFRTNVDDVVSIGAEHRLRFEIESGTGGLKPYIHVRDRLEALVARSVFYDLVAAGTKEMHDGELMFGVWSAGTFFAMAPASDIEA